MCNKNTPLEIILTLKRDMFMSRLYILNVILLSSYIPLIHWYKSFLAKIFYDTYISLCICVYILCINRDYFHLLCDSCLRQYMDMACLSALYFCRTWCINFENVHIHRFLLSFFVWKERLWRNSIQLQSKKVLLKLFLLVVLHKLFQQFLKKCLDRHS